MPTDDKLKKLKEDTFNMVADAPYGWLSCALKLKHTADKIDIDLVNPTKNKDLLLLPVRDFLMALSFENLLKGLIITHGKRYTKKFFNTHDMGNLLSKFDHSKFKIDKKERALLLDMEQTIRWKGRYPIPLEVDDYDMVMSKHSSTEMRVEKDLWTRLVKYLKENGWVSQRVPLSSVRFTLEE